MPLKNRNILLNAVRTAVILVSLLMAESVLLMADSKPIYIGLNADLSSGSALSGVAIRRGIQIAIAEINQKGGVLNRPLQLKVMDHRGIPARGRFNIQTYVNEPEVVAIVGGLHTPVIMAEKKRLFDNGEAQIPYLIPWAAGTLITDNPWIFRLSVRDEDAGPFLIQKALQKGHRRVALLLERTAWGRSNEQSMVAALTKIGLKPTSLQWFAWKTDQVRIAQKLETIFQAGAEVVIMVANAPEGATIVQAMAERKQEQRLPIISHWGITGGGFPSRVGDILGKVELTFLQTYSFLEQPHSEKNRRFVSLATTVFPKEIQRVEDIFSPVGTAHAYDLTHLLAIAIAKAGTTDRSKLRGSLEDIGRYSGLVKTYTPPFKKGVGKNHEALSADDFKLCRYQFDEMINRWLIIPEK